VDGALTPEATRASAYSLATKRPWAFRRLEQETVSQVSVTILICGYRAKCAARRCEHLARLVLRFADRSGRPEAEVALCFSHTRKRVAQERAAGLMVYDDRE
jgi:hypothetical protein